MPMGFQGHVFELPMEILAELRAGFDHAIGNGIDDIAGAEVVAGDAAALLDLEVAEGQIA